MLGEEPVLFGLAAVQRQAAPISRSRGQAGMYEGLALFYCEFAAARLIGSFFVDALTPMSVTSRQRSLRSNLSTQ